MISDNEYRQLSLRIGQTNLVRVDRKKRRFRESLDTLILGSLSTAVGVVVLIALLWGMVGRPVQGWNEAPIASGTKYLIPTKDCGIAAVVGEFLGLAGIVVAKIPARGDLTPLGPGIRHLVEPYVYFLPACGLDGTALKA